MKKLIVLLENRVAGAIVYENDRLSFSYDDDWRDWEGSYPLSLSMPLTQRRHGDATIRAFVWNLLPDNERTLSRWARQFHISARNPFALIGAVGEDCAGAAQFVQPNRVDALLSDEMTDIAWLEESEVGTRLRSVRDEANSGRTAGENGQFSLAGAQSKTALLFHEDRWGVPSGRIPTTHILKPPSGELPGHAENEHLCLQLAASLRMATARSFVRDFDGRCAIVVERYDRARIGPSAGDLARIHQEDMCQTTATMPDSKYQNEGGPGAADIVRLVKESVRQPLRAGDRAGDPAEWDSRAFVRALIFNWMIGGTDAHAKNYGLLIGRDTVRLAPLYDIASAFAFPDIQAQRMKLAMKIEYYRLDRICLRHWERWAQSARLDPDSVIAAIRNMAAELPDRLSDVIAEMRRDGLRHDAIERLGQKLPERAVGIAAL